ncbi:hypothetical protein ACUW5Y_000043 [Staphylococcus lugdunensis]
MESRINLVVARMSFSVKEMIRDDIERRVV